MLSRKEIDIIDNIGNGGQIDLEKKNYIMKRPYLYKYYKRLHGGNTPTRERRNDVEIDLLIQEVFPTNIYDTKRFLSGSASDSLFYLITNRNSNKKYICKASDILKNVTLFFEGRIYEKLRELPSTDPVYFDLKNLFLHSNKNI